MLNHTLQNMLPAVVLGAIRESYLSGIAAAEKNYVYSREDEDCITGALGQALISEDQIIFDDGNVFVWRTTYGKFRGRGKNATEKLLGADGIFQLEVRDVVRNETFRKGILFQAKNNWSHKDEKLARQVEKLSDFAEIGIVINYASEGYSACSAAVANKANGNRRDISDNDMHSLSDVLGNHFLQCQNGLEGVFYDPLLKSLSLPFTSFPMKQAYRHVLTTNVVMTRAR